MAAEFIPLNEKDMKIGKRIKSGTDTYVVVDLETTGRNHYKDEITEIGAIRYEAGKETERFEVLLKTEVAIPPVVEKKTGISNDMLRLLGTEPKEALEAFRDFLGDSVVVGHNFTSFDSYFLEDAYVKKLNCHFSNDYIDTLYLSRKVFPQFKHHSLEYLSQEYEIDYSKAHRALEDCEINHKVYEYLTFGYLLCDETGKTALETEPETLVESESLEEWQVKLTSKFAELENEFALWKGSFSIMKNKSKGGKVSSYAICVYEPDLVEERKDSSRNTILARVREDVLKSNANIVEVYSKSFGQADEKKRFEKDSDELIDCLVGCIRSGIQNYVPKADVFACCSRYQECSNAGKCIHPNGLYAKACQYRKNLEEGNVFY